MDAGVAGDRRRNDVPSYPVHTAVSFPASLPSNLAVGASTDWDYRADYSQYGDELDLVAPSSGGFAGITTTDRRGSEGYNATAGAEGDDTVLLASAFGGTSSATPVAAGIAALLLSRNPGLTAEQVSLVVRHY